VGDDQEATRGDQRREVGAKLALCGLHHAERAERCGQRLQGGPVGPGGRDVPDRHATRRLLQGEVAQVGKDEGQLLFVVRTAGRLPGRLDEDDPEGLGIFAGQRADLP
jgi:hypothetical protein